MRKNSLRKQRNDGWANVLNGYGTNKYDPYRSNKIVRNLFTTQEDSEILFGENGIFRKIITAPADEACRAGFYICENNKELEDEQVNRLQSVYEDLGGEEKFSNSLAWDRCYGGGAILMHINDGADIEEPINHNAIKNIESLKVYSAKEVMPYSICLDYSSVKAGQCEVYQVTDAETGASFNVHESRLLKFEGDLLPNHQRRARNGWGAMILESIYNDLSRYDQGNDLTIMLLSRLSQGILKMGNLMNTLTLEDGEDKVRRFLHVLDMSRHILNTVAIDGADEYDMKNISITGVSDIIDKMQNALSAVVSIPVTILFGRSPGGQNATGEADFEAYYSLINRIQRRKLKPNLSKFIGLLAECKDYGIKLPNSYTVEFKPLKIPSEKERAETKKFEAEAKERTANTRKTYRDIGALDAVEIRDKLEDEGEYKLDRTLDNAGGFEEPALGGANE